MCQNARRLFNKGSTLRLQEVSLPVSGLTLRLSSGLPHHHSSPITYIGLQKGRLSESLPDLGFHPDQTLACGSCPHSFPFAVWQEGSVRVCV